MDNPGIALSFLVPNDLHARSILAHTIMFKQALCLTHGELLYFSEQGASNARPSDMEKPPKRVADEGKSLYRDALFN
jgi:hypothetical protein